MLGLGLRIHPTRIYNIVTGRVRPCQAEAFVIVGWFRRPVEDCINLAREGDQ